MNPIMSYHAHIYFRTPAERARAAWMRERIAERFLVQLGRWHEQRIGPHDVAMYQVAFDVPVFATFVPWLMLNRKGLSVLVHPNTLAPRADHLHNALWLGDVQKVHPEILSERIEAHQEDAIVPNTQPTLAPWS